MTRRRALAWMGGAAAALGGLRLWTGSGQPAAAAQTGFEITRSEAEWRKRLTPEQFHILRQHGTERAGTSPLNREHRRGTFACAGCQLPCSPRRRSTRAGRGGPASPPPSRGPWGRPPTGASS